MSGIIENDMNFYHYRKLMNNKEDITNEIEELKNEKIDELTIDNINELNNTLKELIIITYNNNIEKKKLELNKKNFYLYIYNINNYNIINYYIIKFLVYNNLIISNLLDDKIYNNNCSFWHIFFYNNNKNIYYIKIYYLLKKYLTYTQLIEIDLNKNTCWHILIKSISEYYHYLLLKDLINTYLIIGIEIEIFDEDNNDIQDNTNEKYNNNKKKINKFNIFHIKNIFNNNVWHNFFQYFHESIKYFGDKIIYTSCYAYDIFIMLYNFFKDEDIRILGNANNSCLHYLLMNINSEYDEKMIKLLLIHIKKDDLYYNNILNQNCWGFLLNPFCHLTQTSKPSQTYQSSNIQFIEYRFNIIKYFYFYYDKKIFILNNNLLNFIRYPSKKFNFQLFQSFLCVFDRDMVLETRNKTNKKTIWHLLFQTTKSKEQVELIKCLYFIYNKDDMNIYDRENKKCWDYLFEGKKNKFKDKLIEFFKPIYYSFYNKDINEDYKSISDLSTSSPPHSPTHQNNPQTESSSSISSINQSSQISANSHEKNSSISINTSPYNIENNLSMKPKNSPNSVSHPLTPQNSLASTSSHSSISNDPISSSSFKLFVNNKSINNELEFQDNNKIDINYNEKDIDDENEDSNTSPRKKSNL